MKKKTAKKKKPITAPEPRKAKKTGLKKISIESIEPVDVQKILDMMEFIGEPLKITIEQIPDESLTNPNI